ncbi:MAG: glucose-1-phosphate adenylyltransferase, partial [Myxococcota bacterium]
RDIGTMRSFYDAHMDLVKPSPAFRFDAHDWPIYTASRFLPCARITETMFTRSMLADGTLITSSIVEDSVIGVRTTIRGATIKRTLIMGADSRVDRSAPSSDIPPVGIGEGTIVHDAIIDKNARIGRNVRILNEAKLVEAVGDGWAIRDGIVVIPKDAIIPDNTVI